MLTLLIIIVSPVLCRDEAYIQEEERLCNVAYRRQTKSSSTYVPQSNTYTNDLSCNAVDGLCSQDYFDGSCIHTLEDQDPWWEVDLGAVYDVLFVKLLVRADNPDYHHYDKADNTIITVDGTQCSHYYGPTNQLQMNSFIQINCTSGTHGQHLRLTRLVKPGYLMFCEVEVYAKMSSVTCPEPPEPWHCRNLSYVVTSTALSTSTSWTTFTTQDSVTTNQKSVTTSKTISYQDVVSTTFDFGDTTSHSFVITSSPNVQTELCLCPCNSIGSNAAQNITTEEVMEKLKEIINDIKVDAKTTSLAKNKLVSAKDDRPSAKAVGYLGIALIITIGATVVLLDLDVLLRFLKRIVDSR